jgi:hypothetical protein
MQRPEREVTLGQPFDEQPDAVDIHDLRKAQTLVLHLAVDGPEGFFARDDVGIDAHLLQRLADQFEGFSKAFSPHAPGRLDCLVQGGIPKWMQIAKRQVK